MAMVVVEYSSLQADSQPKSGGLVWGSTAVWRWSTFIKWTEWTLAMTCCHDDSTINIVMGNIIIIYDPALCVGKGWFEPPGCFRLTRTKCVDDHHSSTTQYTRSLTPTIADDWFLVVRTKTACKQNCWVSRSYRSCPVPCKIISFNDSPMAQ